MMLSQTSLNSGQSKLLQTEIYLDLSAAKRNPPKYVDQNFPWSCSVFEERPCVYQLKAFLLPSLDTPSLLKGFRRPCFLTLHCKVYSGIPSWKGVSSSPSNIGKLIVFPLFRWKFWRARKVEGESIGVSIIGCQPCLVSNFKVFKVVLYIWE